MIDPLDLHGPAQRIQAAAEAARAGKCVLTSSDGRGPELAERLDLALAHQGYRVLSLRPDHTPAHCADHLGVASIADPGRLLLNPDLNRQVIQIDCRSRTWRDWGILVLQRLAGGAPVECVRFWLVWPDAEKRPGARQIHALDWVGCITPSDSRIFAVDRFRDRPGPGSSRYWETLATELAGPDLELIDRMAGLKSPLLDPIAWLAQCPLPAHPVCMFDGLSRFESPIDLARRGDARSRDELHRRIWNAQVKTLFPAMEAERPGFLASFKRTLDASYQSAPDPEVKRIPHDVEWGPAFVRLRGDRAITDATKSFLLHAKEVRNALAHGEAVGPTLLAEFLASASATLKGRWSQ